MADTPLILGTDKLRDAYPKLNEAISKSNTVQAQLDQLVVEGSIDPETAQARVAADGTTFTILRDRLNNSDSLLAQIVYNINSFPLQIPEADDTARIQRAIDKCASDGGGEVMLLNELYNISSPIRMKNRVRLVGKNSDISVYNYNQGFTGVFATTIKLADNSNCDMFVFPDRVVNASLERVFLNGNRATQTSGRGVYFEALISPYRGRNKLENVMVYNTFDQGIYNSDLAYEVEILSSMVFYCGNSSKAGAYIGGQDCVLEEFSSGYNYGDGIEITSGGALRAFNVDSFYNQGDGISIHDVMSLSFIRLTANNNGKNNIRIYQGKADGYMPSKLYFLNSSINTCADNYSEILMESTFGTYSANAVSFVNCVLGSLSRVGNAKYIFENTVTNKFEVTFVGCSFYKQKYTGIFNTTDVNSVIGCVDESGAVVSSYNRLLKQRNGVDLETVGYDYKTADVTLSTTKRFNTVTAGTGNRIITLPKANTMRSGQEVVVRKHDPTANTVTIQASSGDSIDAPVTVLSSSKQVLRFITDGISTWFNA